MNPQQTRRKQPQRRLQKGGDVSEVWGKDLSSSLDSSSCVFSPQKQWSWGRRLLVLVSCLSAVKVKPPDTELVRWKKF